MKLYTNETKVRIFLCNPSCFWKLIDTNKKIKIKNLLHVVLHDNAYTCVYNGSIVDQESTLESIGIENGKVLLIIKTINQTPNEIDHRWIKLSQDKNFENQLKMLNDTRVKHEFNRLNDLKRIKIESNHKLYMKQVHKKYIKESQNGEEKIELENVEKYYQKPKELPCESLPLLWKE